MLYQRGFVGLLGLLIAVAIIVLLAVKILTRLYGAPPTDTLDPIQQGRSIIDSAEEAKRAIEERNRGI